MKLPPEDDPLSIGNILVEMGLLSADELTILVQEFKLSENELLGQFIVRKTRVTEEQVEIAWMKQERLRKKINHRSILKACRTSSKSSDKLIAKSNEIISLVAVLVAKA